jgi:hypothetical protein
VAAAPKGIAPKKQMSYAEPILHGYDGRHTALTGAAL